MGNAFEGFEVVSSYSRAEAIEDGVLIDITQLAGETGIMFPVAIATTAFANLTDGRPKEFSKPKGEGQGLDDWEVSVMLNVLYLLRHAIRNNLAERSTLAFRGPAGPIDLKAVCGPGDEGEPVITIMLPGED